MAALLLSTGLAVAQRVKETSVPLGEALDRALEQSSLTHSNAKPFHLKVHLFESTNPPSEYRAEIEEHWISPQQWRRSVDAAEGQPVLVWPPVQSGKTTGLLSMYISVDRKGRVREAYPLNSDNAGLQDAARDQLLKWKLKPMVANRVPVQAEAALSFRFETTLASGPK